MLSYRELLLPLRKLNLKHAPVIVHASLRKVGPIRGGGEALIAALTEACGGVIAPTFTYQTMIRPRVGPPLNGLAYGSFQDQNLMAEIFHPDMPPHRMMGMLPRILLRHPEARRTRHPLLSFGGIHADDLLSTQTLYNPLAPIEALAARGGWILLIGVDHTSNTSIHYGEKLAGRRQFLRWALTSHGVRALPGFPGCSLGFNEIIPEIAPITRQLQIGKAQVLALPAGDLIDRVAALVRKNPVALLCHQSTCLRCQDIRLSPRQGV